MAKAAKRVFLYRWRRNVALTEKLKRLEAAQRGIVLGRCISAWNKKVISKQSYACILKLIV
jgi:hypothetical protein